MSNIEPTEEQRAAAIRLWSRAGPTGHGMAAAVDEIARLLAEREAKAMCKGAAIAWGTVWDSSAPSDVIKVAEDVKGLHLRIDRLTAHAKAADEGIAEREAKLRARVAELEHWERIAGDRHHHAVELECREAQQLADIRAGRKAVAAWLDDPWLEGRRKLGEDFMAATAHYDDAKAAEGGEG